MKTRVEGVASCETPPVLPRNSPPLQASARPGRKESFFDALTLWNRICRLKPSCQRSLQIKTGAANEYNLKLSVCPCVAVAHLDSVVSPAADIVAPDLVPPVAAPHDPLHAVH